MSCSVVFVLCFVLLCSSAMCAPSPQENVWPEYEPTDDTLYPANVDPDVTDEVPSDPEDPDMRSKDSEDTDTPDEEPSDPEDPDAQSKDSEVTDTPDDHDDQEDRQTDKTPEELTDLEQVMFYNTKLGQIMTEYYDTRNSCEGSKLLRELQLKFGETNEQLQNLNDELTNTVIKEETQRSILNQQLIKESVLRLQEIILQQLIRDVNVTWTLATDYLVETFQPLGDNLEAIMKILPENLKQLLDSMIEVEYIIDFLNENQSPDQGTDYLYVPVEEQDDEFIPDDYERTTNEKRITFLQEEIKRYEEKLQNSYQECQEDTEKAKEFQDLIDAGNADDAEVMQGLQSKIENSYQNIDNINRSIDNIDIDGLSAEVSKLKVDFDRLKPAVELGKQVLVIDVDSLEFNTGP